MYKNYLLIGIALALCMTLLYNSGNIVMSIRNPETLSYPKTEAVDELYYLGLIREAAQGHWSLGNVSLKEHRDADSITTFLPLIPGTFMWFTGTSLWNAVLITDIVFPFLVTFLMYLAVLGLMRNVWEAVCVTVIVLGIWPDMMNVVNPKMVLLSYTAYLALFLYIDQPQKLHFLLRGALLTSLYITYPHHFLYFAAVEGCDSLRRWIQKTQTIKVLAMENGLIALPLITFGIWKMIVHTAFKSIEKEDFWHRVVIESHLPAAPSLQAIVIAFLILTFFFYKKEGMDKIIVLIVSILIVLNQQILHGMEIMFGLHYTKIAYAAVWISGALIAHHAIRKKILLIAIFGMLSVYTIVQIGTQTHNDYIQRKKFFESFSDSSKQKVLLWLNEQDDEQVILAPYEIADFVPVYTNHYVAMSRYARYQSVSDAELAKRYVLQRSVETIKEDPTYVDVFSVHAGNIAGRERMWCRVKSFFQKSDDECRVSIRSKIRNQHVLKSLEEDKSAFDDNMMKSLLNRFHVDIIVSATQLSSSIIALCPEQKVIGTYHLYSCRMR